MLQTEVTRGFPMSDRILERSAIALERFVTAINSSVPDRCGTAEVAVPWSPTRCASPGAKSRG